MRKALFALPLLASALILPRAAHADTLSFIVSVIGSGSIGADTFTDQRVTFTASIPEQDLLQIFSESGDNPGSFATCGIPSTATVQGVGTFGGPQLTCVVHNFTDTGTFSIGDGDNGLTISMPFAFDSFQSTVGPVYADAFVNLDFCDPEDRFPCPPIFNTSGGAITITSYEASTGFSELLVTSSTPEPSTFTLLATGFLGVGCLLRRGRSINA